MSKMRRRQWLKTAAAASFGAYAGCAGRPTSVSISQEPSRVVFLRFGGGVRRDDVFGPADLCLAPALRAAAAEGTLFANVRNSGLTRHDCATRYLLTGRYGASTEVTTDPATAVAETTRAALVHEVFRRTRQLPQHKALVVGIPEHSDHPIHGAPFRASSFAGPVPGAKPSPYALDPTLHDPLERRLANQRLGRLALALSGQDAPIQSDRRRPYVESLVDAELEKPGITSTSLSPAWKEWLVERAMRERSYVDEYAADELLADLAIAGMRTTRPDLACVGFVTPDLAHRGSWREYAAAVRGLDRQVQRILEFIATDVYYRDRTLVLIAPDTGRGRSDFTEHQRADEDPTQREVFVVAWGATPSRGRTIERAYEQTAVAPTIAAALGFQLAQAETAPLSEALS